MLLQPEHIAVLDHTLNSGFIVSIVVGYYYCWCCTTRTLLELVEDTGLLRRSFAVGYCALTAWGSWHGD
ncbi:hypothetical protein DL98DRAFT_212223 [Cadophora sp. DSE1049]|nr:hypothetical protein DL98DRAFT_212223 [Cadophora sp. DSE1049]